MAEYLIQDSTLTSIGNEIRTLRSSSSKMSPATMTSNLKSANTEVNNQTTIMNQILAALETKGDGGLNFKVVGGTTAPSNPVENTIWVNTSTTITSWEFSATQPIASSGKIWIRVGTLSVVEFNTLKENGVKVYPMSAKQYVSGEWVDKVAKSWQNNKWVDWINYILNATTDKTGGWKWYPSGSGPSVTRQSDGSYIITRPSTAYGPGFLYMTNNSFDLSDINTIEFEILQTNGTDTHYIGIMNPNNTSSEYATARKEVTSSISKYSIDVSTYSGMYAFAANVSAGGTLIIANVILRG